MSDSSAAAPSSTFKRRRLSPPPVTTPTYSLDDEDDESSAPTYVPVKKRREALLSKLSSRHGQEKPAEKQETEEEREEREREEAEGVRRSKTAKTLLMEAQEVKRLKAIAGTCPEVTRTRCPKTARRDVGCVTLTEAHSATPTEAQRTDLDRKKEEEDKILAAQSAGQKALAGAEELAKGIVYTERMKTT